MPEPVYRTFLFLARLVAFLPVGTNQGILHLLWTIVSGKLLASRGALFPALAAAGLDDAQSRRAEAALRVGKLNIARLLERFICLIKREHKALPAPVGRWNPLLIDWVGFYRPHLKGCVTRHFCGAAGKALPAIELGMVARCLRVGERRVPVLCGVVRSGETLPLLQAARAGMQNNDVLVADRQVKISHLEAEGITHFVIRGAVDFTARDKAIPKATGRGRKPTQGDIVRPLSRTYKGNVIAATPAHREESFAYQGRTLCASWFDDLILTGGRLCFRCVVIRDPKYKNPWLLLTDLSESAEAIFMLYRSRWKIEQIPQTGKQLLGGHRSFVHGDESRYRLPELCLVAASIALYLSATSKAIATGFWDRHPKATPGRYRRALGEARLPDMRGVTSELGDVSCFCGKEDKSLGRIRAKCSVWGHLPAGARAHRRQKGQYANAALTGN